MHLCLCSNVDTAGRLVDNEDLGAEGEPSREHDLLLISAGEIGNLLFRARHPNLHGFPEPIESRALLSFVQEEPGTDELVQRSDRKIATHCELKEQCLLLAVLGNEADALPDRIVRRTNRYRSAVDLDVAGREPICSEDGSCEFGPPGSDQSGDSDDLAGANLKVNPVEHCRTGGPPPARRVNATHRKAY